jgi:DNA topoisomerase I
VTDPIEAARSAGLRYTTDHSSGYRRKRFGKGFIYISRDGQPLKDREEIARIEALVIPPAWQEVWICQNPNGHLQATGRDARRRKQYRYHSRWRVVRDADKYARLIEFAGRLPQIRRQVQKDMGLPGLPKRKVLATLVQLLETTFIRIGNEEYARHNNSFGLTTLRNRHAAVSGEELRFEFRGKGGKDHVISLRDRRLARIVKKCQELPGHELFQFLDETQQRQSIDSGDVNEYLKEITNQDFTAKDYRTWAGTVLASLALKDCQGFKSQTEGKRNIVKAIEAVASKLGNTRSICRKCYIHPAVIDAYLDGTMLRNLKPRRTKASAAGLRPEEAMVVALLQQRLIRECEEGKRAS